jgi:hypothetical protein
MSHFPTSERVNCADGLACEETVGRGGCAVSSASSAFGVREHMKIGHLARFAAGVCTTVIGALLGCETADASVVHTAFFAPSGGIRIAELQSLGQEIHGSWVK